MTSQRTPSAPCSRSVRLRRAIAAIATTVMIAGGCSGGSSTTASTTTAASSTSAPVDTLAPPTIVDDDKTTVRAIDNDFEPKHLQVQRGTTVEFINVGHNKHNIIPDDPAAADFSVTEEDFPTGSSYDFTFTKPGTYAYYCSLHATPTAGSMRGVITVTP